MKTYVTASQLAEIYSVSVATIWRWAARGVIPQPKKFSPGCTRWNAEAVARQLDANSSHGEAA